MVQYRLLLMVGVLLAIVACNSKVEEEKEVNKSDQKVDKTNPTDANIFADLTEEGIRKKLIEFLSKGRDHFLVDSSFRFYKGKMNMDDVPDWIVTVNELGFAKKQLEEMGNMGAIDYGYLGNYNHVFVIDGATGKWNGRPIGSSAVIPLEIDIDYVNSAQYQVVKVFYRIGTSKFVAVFNSSVPSFQELFKWELYNLSDPKNQGEPRANIVEFAGEEGMKKQIHVFDAKVQNFDQEAFIANMFFYEPALKKASPNPIHEFEYQLVQSKYGEIKK